MYSEITFRLKRDCYKYVVAYISFDCVLVVVCELRQQYTSNKVFQTDAAIQSASRFIGG